MGGLKRTGKTSVLEVSEKMCFNSLRSSNISTSALFRMIDSVSPCLLIDEVDILASKKVRPELRSILLNGYKKGAFVFRAEQKGQRVEFGVEKYFTYSPKMICNITGIEKVLEDRTISIIMKRTKRKEYGERLLNIDDDIEFKKIRDLLYFSIFKFWKVVRDTYDLLETDEKLHSREWELWKPLLTMAKICGVYEESLENALKKSKEKFVEDVTEQMETQLVRSILKMVVEYRYYKIANIKKDFLQNFDFVPDWLNSQWIGYALKRLGFKDKRTVSGRREYNLDPKDVKDLAERLGIDVEEVMKEREIQETLGDSQ